MNAEQKALWQRLQAHELDDAQSARPFSLRLALENNWGPAFTQRVIEEYRRFAFLAVAAGHPVSPSDAVDQAWHLHLLYTRDYWGDFCGKVLGRPLHHGPTRGGAAEADKFTDWYGQTRASYRTFFGEPPLDIWPEAPRHPHAVRVDVAEHWMIRKPRVLQRLAKMLARRPRARRTRAAAGAPPGSVAAVPTTGIAVVALAVMFFLPSRAEAAIHGGPFDLAGPEFLKFFLMLTVGALGLGMLLRWLARGSAAESDHRSDALDGYEAAYLAGGKLRMLHTALASLYARGLIDVQDKEIYRKNGVVSPSLPLIERAVVQAARVEGEKVRVVRRHANDAMESTVAGLRERGLVMRAEQKFHATLWPALLALGVIAVAVNKILIGLDRNRPVTFLVVLAVFWVVAFFMLLNPPRVTRRGSQLLSKALHEHRSRTRVVPEMVPQGPLGATHFALIVGLFGWTALRGTPLGDLERQVVGIPTDTSSSSDSSSSDSDSGSSGGDSGGGDGGGGCGGCGGGGGD